MPRGKKLTEKEKQDREKQKAKQKEAKEKAKAEKANAKKALQEQKKLEKAKAKEKKDYEKQMALEEERHNQAKWEEHQRQRKEDPEGFIDEQIVEELCQLLGIGEHNIEIPYFNPRDKKDTECRIAVRSFLEHLTTNLKGYASGEKRYDIKTIDPNWINRRIEEICNKIDPKFEITITSYKTPQYEKPMTQDELLEKLRQERYLRNKAELDRFHEEQERKAEEYRREYGKPQSSTKSKKRKSITACTPSSSESSSAKSSSKASASKASSSKASTSKASSSKASSSKASSSSGPILHILNDEDSSNGSGLSPIRAAMMKKASEVQNKNPKPMQGPYQYDSELDSLVEKIMYYIEKFRNMFGSNFPVDKSFGPILFHQIDQESVSEDQIKELKILAMSLKNAIRKLKGKPEKMLSTDDVPEGTDPFDMLFASKLHKKEPIADMTSDLVSGASSMGHPTTASTSSAASSATPSVQRDVIKKKSTTKLDLSNSTVANIKPVEDIPPSEVNRTITKKISQVDIPPENVTNANATGSINKDELNRKYHRGIVRGIEVDGRLLPKEIPYYKACMKSLGDNANTIEKPKGGVRAAKKTIKMLGPTLARRLYN